MPIAKRLTAEFIGTLGLVLGAALATVVYRWVGGEEPPLPQVTGNP